MSEWQIELFYLGDSPVPAGALVTATHIGEFYCHIRFSTPDGGLVENKVVINMDGSVREWTAFTYRGAGKECGGVRDNHGVTVAGRRGSQEGMVIPSYGVSALVGEMVRRQESEINFLWLAESAASPEAVAPARLERAGDEDVASPFAGMVPECVRVELSVDGARTNTYWARDGVIVATDWNGAKSYALPADTASHLRAVLGLGSIGRP